MAGTACLKSILSLGAYPMQIGVIGLGRMGAGRECCYLLQRSPKSWPAKCSAADPRSDGGVLPWIVGD